jgi:hypothetical protein
MTTCAPGRATSPRNTAPPGASSLLFNLEPKHERQKKWDAFKS